MRVPYADRRDAGCRLAEIVPEALREPVDIVLALPRGGVPVAFEIARALRVPLDVVVVRKLGFPSQPELAMGAIASGGVRVLNEDPGSRDVDPEALERVVRRELAELERREALYRDGREPAPVAGRHVLVADDGLATGASMRAAIAALRQRGVRRLTVAVPVGAPETCAEIEREADQLICPVMPREFLAVGYWYRDFSPTTDAEVRSLLAAAAAQAGPPPTPGS